MSVLDYLSGVSMGLMLGWCLHGLYWALRGWFWPHGTAFEWGDKFLRCADCDVLGEAHVCARSTLREKARNRVNG